MFQFYYQDLVLNLVTNKPNKHHHQDLNRIFHLYGDGHLFIQKTKFHQKKQKNFIFAIAKKNNT